MKFNLKLISASSTILCLTGCSTALTVADFMVSPIGSSRVYYDRNEINAPYVQAEKEFVVNEEQIALLNKQNIKWIQPSNKKQSCKLPMFFELDKRRKIYWDGACKSGYAYGLGREIHLAEDYHKEVIIEHDKSKKENYGAYVIRDYLTKTTIRGYFKGNIATKVGYANQENIIEDKRTGESRIENSEGIQNVDGISFKKFESKFGGLIIWTETQGLRYIKVLAENVIHNYPSEYTTISLTSDSFDTSIGESNKRVLSKFIVNGDTHYFWLKNGTRKAIGIVGDGQDYFIKSDQVINSAIKEFDKYYQACNSLEEKYLFRLKRSTKKPAGLTSRIYYEIENYYSKDLMQRVANTQNQDATTRKHNSQVRELEQRQKDAEARASRIKTEQMLNQIYQNNQSSINKIQQSSTPNLEVQPLETNTPSVYRTQRINDNMAIIQQIK